MLKEKTCPKCPGSQKMEKVLNMKCIIPGIIGGRSDSRTSETLGLPVAIYQCHHCHFVELYTDYKD